MEKDRSIKIIAIVALLVAVIGLSVGFAAFSHTLTIKSAAEVNVNATDFDVDFSTKGTEQADGAVEAVLTPTSATTTTIEGNKVLHADPAIISNADRVAPVIKDIKAFFTEPGQTATYSFYVHNTGKIPAYLNTVTFENALSGSDHKVCTPVEGTDATLTASACEGITFDVTVGTQKFDSSDASVNMAVLEPDAYLPVVVTIKYLENSTRTDGDFTVSFGDVTLTYSALQ